MTPISAAAPWPPFRSASNALAATQRMPRSSADWKYLFRSRWHCRRMVIDYEPALTTFYVGKAVARRQRLHFSILRVGEGIVARVYSRIAIHSDELITERDLQTG